MTDNLLTILKQKPITIPQVLFQNYKNLNLTPEEFLVLIYILNIGDKIPYNPELFATGLSLNKLTVMELINNLSEKNVLNIKIEKNKNNRQEEYIYTDILYDKLLKLIQNQDQVLNPDTTDIIDIFEKEFGRLLSPMELEKIKSWINDNLPKELIVEALKEATYNGVHRMSYIDKILFDWQSKGLKTKEDVKKDRNSYKQSKTKEIEVYDYNWLEEDE